MRTIETDYLTIGAGAVGIVSEIAKLRGTSPSETSGIVRSNLLRLVDQDAHLSACEQIGNWLGAHGLA